MIYFAIIAVILGIGVVVWMRDEIASGYARQRDYLLVTPMMGLGGCLLFWLAHILPWPEGGLALLVLPVRIFLTFAVMVLFWGTTLTTGAFLIKAFKKT